MLTVYVEVMMAIFLTFFAVSLTAAAALLTYTVWKMLKEKP